MLQPQPNGTQWRRSLRLDRRPQSSFGWPCLPATRAARTGLDAADKLAIQVQSRGFPAVGHARSVASAEFHREACFPGGGVAGRNFHSNSSCS
jgi:hypothetical protein